MLTVKTPKPYLVFADFPMFTAYAWKCEHKKYGIQTLGDTAEEAKKDFRDIIADELYFSGVVKTPEMVKVI